MPKILARLLLLSLTSLFVAACQTTPPPEPPKKGLTAEQIAVLKAEGFQETDDGWKYDLSGKVLFATNSTQVAPESVSLVQRLAKILLDIGIHGIVVEGHTDNQGSAEYNQRLSEQRAQAVAEVVYAAGLQKEWALVRGLGLTKPVADNNTEQGRSENRRVSLIVGSSLTPL